VSKAIPDERLRQAVTLLQQAEHVVALTGAGISTPSGIPDFRSSGSGLWTKVDPMRVASLAAFRYHPEEFYAWIQPLAKEFLRAEPNGAHIALARLEQAGYLQGVITQNIDDLHQRAGSKVVLEIHGHLREATCVSCYNTISTEDILGEFASTGAVPRCGLCSGVLKPNVVLFGEQLPFHIVQQAQELLEASDLLIIAGSSLEATPAAHLPLAALSSGASLIIFNNMPTYLDERAAIIFREDVALSLPMVVDEVLSE
jgi:NAD-dependent deacetylase